MRAVALTILLSAVAAQLIVHHTQHTLLLLVTATWARLQSSKELQRLPYQTRLQSSEELQRLPYRTRLPLCSGSVHVEARECKRLAITNLTVIAEITFVATLAHTTAADTRASVIALLTATWRVALVRVSKTVT